MPVEYLFDHPVHSLQRQRGVSIGRVVERKEIDDLKTLTLVLMLRIRHPDLFGARVRALLSICQATALLTRSSGSALTAGGAASSVVETGAAETGCRRRLFLGVGTGGFVAGDSWISGVVG